MAGEEGLEPSNAGIKIQCLNQLGDSPTQLVVDQNRQCANLALAFHDQRIRDQIIANLLKDGSLFL